MRFEITKEGRTLYCTMEEKVCCYCKTTKSPSNRWYYYDHPYSKGLYCRKCGVSGKTKIFIHSDAKKQHQFWLIDVFKTPKKTVNITAEEAALLEQIRLGEKE